MATPELFTAVLASPDDDAPRRVLADALSEAGDPRGELILVQCALAAPGPDSPDRETLRERERELLRAHEARWREELPRVPGLVWGPLRRGFVEAIVVSSAAAFVAQAEAILRASPIVDLRLRNLQDGDHAVLAACPSLAKIRRLRFHNAWFSPDLLRAPVLDGLVELELLSARPRSATAGLFDRDFAQLRELGLDSHYLRPDGIRELAAASHRWPEALRSLDLRRNALDDEGLDLLTQHARLDGLERLGLGENSLSAAALERLAERLTPGRLRELDLRVNPIGDAGAQLLATHPAFTGLTRLNLAACDLHDAGAEALAQALDRPPHSLRDLDLSCNYIETGAFAVLEAMRHTGLNLDFNLIEGFDAQLRVPLDEEPGFDRRFRFSGEDHYCWSGQRHDGRRTVVVVLDDAVELHDLDAAGEELGTERLPLPAFARPPEHSYQAFNHAELLDYLFAKADFNPCEIDVRALPGACGLSLDPYEGGMIEWMLGEDEWFDEEQRTQMPSWTRQWLASGEYIVDYGDARWCHDHGVCHTT